MNRRTFAKSLAMAGAVASTGLPMTGQAQLPTHSQPILLNVALRGGPDFRHLIVPPFSDDSGSYGSTYWSNRWRSHELRGEPSSWRQHWNENFLHIDGDEPFGIWRGAAWLKAQYDLGNVAIINNVVGTTDRNHSHGELIWDTGDQQTGLNDRTRDGWGGRLAAHLDSHVVSMTTFVNQFCFGPHSTDRSSHDNTRVISARNTREIALYEDPELLDNPGRPGMRPSLSRGLQSYYAALADTIAPSSPYAAVLRHEARIREFGNHVRTRLQALPVPAAIEALYEGDSVLNSRSFGKQIRNVFDSLACADIFDFRVGSLSLSGFDTHGNQNTRLSLLFTDLFGERGGFATLYDELGRTMPSARDNLVTVLGGEFGRQLVSNGDEGTDHGRGMTVLVIGNRVNGGVYGELFPSSEIDRYANEASADIAGQTALEPVLSVVAELIESGAGSAVFPRAASLEVETGVALEGILTRFSSEA